MMVAARDFNKYLILLMLAISAFISGTTAMKLWERLSEAEKIELDLQLRIINKPAIKSFQTEYGDIFDCIDIYKQLAFDHPLLKNHTIQMEPKNIPSGMEIGTNSVKEDSSTVFMQKNMHCPKEYVLIKRTTREDLIMAKYLSSHKISNPRNHLSPALRSAVLEYRGVHYGAKANINVWNPSVTEDQLSSATVWITKGVDSQHSDIQAGWIVYHYLYKNYSRLYTYWTADGYQTTGCFNILCPGYIQVSPDIPLGLILVPESIYEGPQYQISIIISQDNATGNWWLVFNNLNIGYWPKSLLPNLSEGATYIAWGGQVYSPLGEASPAMGSGHFPEEEFRGSAFMNNLKLIDDKNSLANPPQVTFNVDEPDCYNIAFNIYPKPEWQYTIYYGGPGNCTD